jgi:hypothetical protein
MERTLVTGGPELVCGGICLSLTRHRALLSFGRLPPPRRFSTDAGDTTAMGTIWPGICWFVGVVDHWQTLVAGIIALVGAWWTVRGIRSQINQTIEFERDQHEREERAARSVLPMALSELAQYATDCIKLLEPYAPVTGNGPKIPAGMAAPRIPEGILGPMQASAKSANATTAGDIAGTLAWMQAQHSRLEGLIQRAAERPGKDIWNIEAIGAIMDAAELHARCAMLFPYSRGSTPDPNLTFKEQLQTALFLAGIVAVDHPGLQAALERRPEPHTFELPKF